MLLHLPALPTILLDIATWLIIHVGVSYLITHIPLSSFDTGFWLYKQRKWEKKRQDLRKNIQIEEVEEKVTGRRCLVQEGVPEETPQGT